MIDLLIHPSFIHSIIIHSCFFFFISQALRFLTCASRHCFRCDQDGEDVLGASPSLSAQQLVHAVPRQDYNGGRCLWARSEAAGLTAWVASRCGHLG